LTPGGLILRCSSTLSLRPRLGALLLAGLGTLAQAQQPAPAAAPAPARAEAPAAAPRFDILEFEVEGNTVLRDADVEAAVMPFMGPQREFADVESARAALEKRYQGAGYLTVFVDIPEQRVDGGVVRLSVTEGRVARLAVTGSRYYDQGQIRSVAAEVAEGKVPNFNELQQELAVLGRADTRRVQPVLKPGALPGTVDVELKVDDKLPGGASVELNNNHAAGIDSLHLVANLHYDNLFQREHSVGLTLLTTPLHPEQSKVIVGNYSVPLADGDSLTASLIHSNSNVVTLGGTQALGKGTTLGLKYQRQLPGSAEVWQAFSAGVDYKDLQDQTVFGGSTISTPLRYAPLQLGYSGGRNGESWLSQWGLTLTYAFAPVFKRELPDCPSAGGGIAPADQFGCKRAGADGGFSTAKLDLRQTLLSGWGQFSLRLAGQLSTQPLANYEQFVIGGADTVRGYYESAAFGDDGVLGSLEWRGDIGRLLRRRHGEAQTANLRELTLLAFADAGRVHTQHALAGTAVYESLSSVGVGLRLQTQAGLSVSFDLAHAMKALPGQHTPDSLLHIRLGQKL
jgi:hemolysin activation/secretion protein